MILLPGLGPQYAGRFVFNQGLQQLQVARLARHFEVWVLDPPTHLPEGFSVRELAESYASTIRFYFTGPVDVVGSSTGGSIALQLAIDHPSTVRRLVLMSAAYKLGDAGRAAQRDMAAHLRNGHYRRAAARMLAATTTAPSQQLLRRAVGQVLGRLALGGQASDLITLLEAEDRFDVSDDLHRVQATTLIVGSGRDGYYPAHLFEETASNIPHARLMQFARKGHLAIVTDATVADIIVKFLR